jgi:hypothetical protein
MVWQYLAAAVAAICAAAHLLFGYKETLGWRWEFVTKAAPSWIEGLDEADAKQHIFWAKRLAFNVGAYNLMLAFGLAWTFYAFIWQPALAGTLGILFGIWLLGAAAAALYTQVLVAAKAQGALGLLLLSATFAFLAFSNAGHARASPDLLPSDARQRPASLSPAGR